LWRSVGCIKEFISNSIMTASVIFTCFVGRERYLKLLVPHINTLLSRGLIDEVHFWDYTRDPSDADYIRTLPFSIFVPKSKENWDDYYEYYTPAKYANPDTVIIKCDDDIVYIDVDHFADFIAARRAHPEALIFSPSVINNPVCSAVLFNRKLLEGFTGTEIEIGAANGKKIHEFFLNNPVGFMTDCLGASRFSKVALNMPKIRFNINFICILARDLGILYQGPYDGHDDEAWLGCHAPKYYNRNIWIDLHFIVAHMAFTDQRAQGFDEEPFIERYSRLLTSQDVT
jgi:hypothetical protein